MTTSPFIHMPPAALRGSRDYVHSTDLYEEIIAAVATAGLSFEAPIDLRIRAKITNRPRYEIVPVGVAVGDAAAICTFTSGGQEYMAVVTETNEAVTARKHYDESPAVQFSTVRARGALLHGETGLKPIEAVTALAVHLHKTALPPPSGQRWMLGQLSIRRALADTETRHLALEIERMIGHTTTRTRITAIDGSIGTMLFVLAGG